MKTYMMKHSKLIGAYVTLLRLIDLQLPPLVAYALYKLKIALDTPVQFYDAEKEKLIHNCHGELQANGDVIFHDDERSATENRDQFIKQITALTETELEVSYEPVTLSLKDLADIKLSAKEIDLLTDFVIFNEE